MSKKVKVYEKTLSSIPKLSKNKLHRFNNTMIVVFIFSLSVLVSFFFISSFYFNSNETQALTVDLADPGRFALAEVEKLVVPPPIKTNPDAVIKKKPKPKPTPTPTPKPKPTPTPLVYEPLFVASYPDDNPIDLGAPDLFETLKDVPFRNFEVDGLVGISNKGNSCYADSVLQTLFRVPLIRKIVANLEVLRPILLHSQKLSEKYISIVEGLNHMFYQLQTIKSAASFGFKNTMQCMPGVFRGYRQEDADEYMMEAFEAVFEFVPKNQKRLYILEITSVLKYVGRFKEGSETEREPHPRLDEIINTVITEENKFLLSIPPEHSQLSLKILLDEFFKLDLANYKWPEEAESLGFMEERKLITFLPEIITFQIKRFRFLSVTITTKIENPIDMPDEIDFKEYCSDDFTGSTLYRLKMFILHSGKTPRSGHYVTYSKESDGNWYLLDDDSVSLIPDSIPDSIPKNQVFHYMENGKIYKSFPKSHNLPVQCVTDTSYIYFYERI